MEKIKLQYSNDELDNEDLNKSMVKLEKFSDSCIGELNNLFAKVDERRRVSFVTILYSTKNMSAMCSLAIFFKMRWNSSLHSLVYAHPES